MCEAILRREVVSNKRVSRFLGVVTFVIFMMLGAFVRIPLPFTPVPLTLQTFFVLLSGAMLGAGLGAISQLSYIALGIAGLPIFASAGKGLGYLLGASGGYIAGFVLASLFLGKVIRRAGNSLVFIFLLMCFADCIILILGTMWLKILFRCSIFKAAVLGFYPFVPGDLIKITAACVIYLKTKPRIEQIF